jgi:hypothetical protein
MNLKRSKLHTSPYQFPKRVSNCLCKWPHVTEIQKYGDDSSGRMYKCVSKNFRTGLLERERQMVELSATRCSCIAILWVSLVSFVAVNFCVASQRVFKIVVYFVIDSVRKLLDTPSYKSRVVLNLSNTGVLGSNPVCCMNICSRWSVALCNCVDRDLVLGWFPIQGIMLRYLEITVSGLIQNGNRPNPWTIKNRKKK